LAEVQTKKDLMLHDCSWEEIAAAFERARAKQPTLTELLDFYERVLKAQYGAEAHPKPTPTSEALLRERSSRGQPIVPREQFPVDLDSAGPLFLNLCRLAKDRGSSVRVAVQEIETAVRSRALDLDDLLRGTVAEEGYPFAIADQAGLDPELLHTLAEASVRPSVQASARSLAPFVDHDRWGRATCPVCGSAPGFAELRGQELAASRYLHCGFCGWAWSVRRLACPFCENTDHKRLQTLIVENYPQVKLEVCEICRRYLKLVDSKEFIGLVPEVEVLTTPHLDLAAMERGYH
jgi:FdhE protein